MGLMEEPDDLSWQKESASHAQRVTIVLAGKYTSFADSCMSVIKGLELSAIGCNESLISLW